MVEWSNEPILRLQLPEERLTIPGSCTSITRNSGSSPSTGSRKMVYCGSGADLQT